MSDSGCSYKEEASEIVYKVQVPATSSKKLLNQSSASKKTGSILIYQFRANRESKTTHCVQTLQKIFADV